MIKTKYITSGGLAFAEDKDMKKLRSYSLKGWHVSDFKCMGYTLEKGESADFIYSVDYRSLEADEKEEYFSFFSSSGWIHIASEGDIHLFLAHPHTKPIYTDIGTTVEKYESLSGSVKKLAIPLVLITVLVWIGAMMSSGILKTLFLILATILSVIAIPAAWTLIATYNNKWAIEGRNRLVNVVKVLPFLFLFIAVIIMLFVEGIGRTGSMLTYMLIGAIAFPTAIWLVMSLYHKIKGKRDYIRN